MRGYSILADDGAPKPAYGALASMAEARDDSGADAPDGPAAKTVEILARDVVVRLSDVDTFYPHWAHAHCPSVPCRHWTGQFYVEEPGTSPWQLEMEVMQVEEPGNLVWINGHLLDPPAIPLRGRPDFASAWTSVEITVPAKSMR